MNRLPSLDKQNLAIGLVGVFGIVMLAVWGVHWRASEIANVVVLWLTAVAIFWNTNESRRSRLEAQLVSLQPHLRLELSANNGVIFDVTNIGKGMARSIHLESFLIKKDSTNSIGFKGIQSLAPGERIRVEPTSKANGEIIKKEIIRSIEAGDTGNLLVTYCDQANWLYEARFRGRKDYRRGFEELGPQKRVRRI